MKASERTARELKILADLPESKIDTSDIPEKSDWSGAVRGRFGQATEAAPRPVTTKKGKRARIA